MKITRLSLVTLSVALLGFFAWKASPRFVHSKQPGQADLAGEQIHKVEVVGIGAVLRLDEESDALIVAHVFPNTPANLAGISPGLVVNKIDGTATKGVPLGDCVERVKGPVGSSVLLELIDPQKETTNTVQVTRQKYSFEDRGPE